MNDKMMYLRYNLRRISLTARQNSVKMATDSCKILGQVEVVNVAYAWKIHDIFKHYANAEVRNPPVLESPVFSADNDGRLKWRLRLTASEEDPRFLSAALQLVSGGSNQQVSAKFRLSVYDRLSEHRYKYLGDYVFAEGESAKVSSFINGYALISEKDDVLPNGALTIMCLINVGAIFCKSEITDDRMRVADDLSDLLSDRTYCDLKFTVFGKEFRAHRCVLAVRCALLLHVIEDRIERTGTRFTFNPPSDFTDIEPEVMEEALRFIYTGRVKDIYKNANSLLLFAEKYGLPRLKDMSEKAMLEILLQTTDKT